MSHPFLPYGRQTVTDADVLAVEDVLRSPFLTQGPLVPDFESALSSALGVPYVTAVNSATSALHLGCISLGLGAGDVLWTSPITFVASANCARYCGAEVDFVDIDPSTGLMSLNALAEKLNHARLNNSLPKVIVPVHLAGTSCPMDEIANLVRPYGISILEDASHAVGASFQSNPVGSCLYSDAAVFSFHPVKIITTGEGGAISTRDPDLFASFNRLRSHGITKDPSEFEFQPDGPWSYEQQELGFNYRLTDFQAALGLSQLNRLCDIIAERNRLFERYQYLLGDLPVRFLEIPDTCISALHLAVIVFPEVSPAKHRQLFEGLRQSGIGVQLHYSPVHLQPYYRRLGFASGDFPHAEAYSRSALSLPLFPGMAFQDQIRVVEVLSSLL
ncbi:UDP-4-amino-4,6-dideoxy-N-acetyl-beta-L-altrosamine transaminase [Synechococcus sp. AH-601-N10]|nr:UDP-4-amino-4,6-dideoxy-N-acetyl-beta-L-altrosamine transaminase [Synechococcus sp. AH-601-N10]